MRRLLGLATLLWFASGFARAGVGVWTPSANSYESPVAVGPGGSIYQGCGELACRSVNHGITWQQLPQPGHDFGSYPLANVLAIDPASVIYLAINTGGLGEVVSFVEASRDGGNTWTDLMPELFGTNLVRLAVDPSSSSTLVLLAGLESGADTVPASGRLSRSTDGGAHWNEIDQALVGPIGAGSVTAFAIDPQSSGHLVAASALVDPISGVSSSPAFYTSGDGGSTWTRTAGNPSGAIATLAVDPFRPSVVYAGGHSGIVRSTDGGATFIATGGVPTTQIVPDPLHQGRLYASTVGSGVLTSSDGGTTWMPMNAGLSSLTVDSIALDAASGYLYAVTPAGTFVYQLPSPAALQLNAAHPFTVTLAATDQRTGRTGAGVATQVNDLWGFFSIPAITGNPNNPEVFVKLLDGTMLNGSYWFFYGGLTDLEYTLTVKDDTTGQQKTYTKPAGSECGGSDTAAFAP